MPRSGCSGSGDHRGDFRGCDSARRYCRSATPAIVGPQRRYSAGRRGARLHSEPWPGSLSGTGRCCGSGSLPERNPAYWSGATQIRAPAAFRVPRQSFRGPGEPGTRCNSTRQRWNCSGHLARHMSSNPNIRKPSDTPTPKASILGRENSVAAPLTAGTVVRDALMAVLGDLKCSLTLQTFACFVNINTARA